MGCWQGAAQPSATHTPPSTLGRWQLPGAALVYTHAQKHTSQHKEVAVAGTGGQAHPAPRTGGCAAGWRLLAQRPPLPAQQGAATTSSPGPAPHPSRHQQQAPEPLTAEARRGSSSTLLLYMMKGQLSDSGPLPAAADAVGRECCPPVTTHTLHATPPHSSTLCCQCALTAW